MILATAPVIPLMIVVKMFPEEVATLVLMIEEVEITPLTFEERVLLLDVRALVVVETRPAREVVETIPLTVVVKTPPA